MKKRVLIFNGYYTPAKKYGGPLTSIKNFVETCNDLYDIYIVAYNHDVGDKCKFEGIEGFEWYSVGKAKVKYISDKDIAYNTRNMSTLVYEVNPDAVWVSGIFWPDVLIPLTKTCGSRIPVLISPRGEVSADRMKIKWYKKYPYVFATKMLGVYKNAWFHGTSEDEIFGIKKHLCNNDEKIFLVPNIGVPNSTTKKTSKKKSGCLRVVFISRIHQVKNLKFAVDLVTNLKGNVVFDVYGPLEQPEYWEECLEKTKRNECDAQIRYCGQLEPDEVGTVFSQYDCFLFPTLNENYGHAIAEALANKCPVILSKGTTPWDDIDGKAGWVCNLEVKEEFVKALENLQMMDEYNYSKLLNSVNTYYVDRLEKDGAISGHKNMFSVVMSD